MTSSSDSIKNLLRIKDYNLIFSGTKEVDSKMNCYAVLKLDHCLHCQSKNIIHNGYAPIHVKHISSDASMPVILQIDKQRIKCRDCLKSSTATTPLIDKHCQISNSLKRKVLAALTEDRSMTSIARENNISASTVCRLLAIFDMPFHQDYDDLPEHLAFDEVRGVGRQLHFICIDGDSHQIMKMLSNRYKKNILAYFYKFSPLARAHVKTVSMDLNGYYQDIVREIFQNAEIVIDRFHIVQMLNRSLNQLRVQVMKTFDVRSRNYKIFKSNWKLFLMRLSDLEFSKLSRFKSPKGYYTQGQLVDEGLRTNLVLSNTYDLVQNILEAMDNKDIVQLEAVINSTLEVGNQMRTTLKTFQKNMKSVLNSIRFTYYNGLLEGINRKIKQIQRTAYGFRNFRNLRIRIKLQQTGTVIKEKRPDLVA